MTRRIAMAGLLWCLTLPVMAAGPAPVIEFLEGEAARLAIVNDRRAPYFSQLQPAEMAAKTGAEVTGTLEAQRAEVRRRYQAAVRPFRPEEKEVITSLVRALAPMLREYPRFAGQRWRFVKVADHIEGSLPHTRDDFIVLSEAAGKHLVDLQRRLSPDAALIQSGMLLVHEQSHVLQRLEPARFETLYTRTLGYRRGGQIPLPADLLTNQIINPDGQDCCWLFPGGKEMIWPMLVLEERDGIRRMPEDFRMLAVTVTLPPRTKGYRVALDAKGRSVAVDLRDVREYVEAFPLTTNFYHPNEAAADLFAQLILFDGVARAKMPAPQRDALEREFARLRPAFQQVFAR